MKSHIPVAMTILIGIAAAAFQGRPTLATAQEHSDRQPPSERRQEFEHRSTAAVQEPSGFTAACFASNLDTVTRTLAATIIDWRGNNVTETSSCGANQGPGITCQSTARFTDSALRCVVSTSGTKSKLRGSLNTSAGPYPFTSPANAIVDAQ